MIRGESCFKKSKTEQREGVKLYRLLHCGSPGKESACNVGDLGLIPWVGKIPWRRERQLIPVEWRLRSAGVTLRR